MYHCSHLPLCSPTGFPGCLHFSQPLSEAIQCLLLSSNNSYHLFWLFLYPYCVSAMCFAIIHYFNSCRSHLYWACVWKLIDKEFKGAEVRQNALKAGMEPGSTAGLTPDKAFDPQLPSLVPPPSLPVDCFLHPLTILVAYPAPASSLVVILSSFLPHAPTLSLRFPGYQEKD